jgi:hypothetical protein
MPNLNMSKTIILLLLARLSLSAPTSTPQDSAIQSPRANADCFATAFGIQDFKSFAGSATLPPTVSFGVSSDDQAERFSCSQAGKAGSTSPFFTAPVRCNDSNFFFSYPEDGVLRIHEVERCGTGG